MDRLTIFEGLLHPGGDDTMKDSDFYYDRQTLYEEVWSEPVYKVAKRYGISNVAIAKTCKKMHIPIPGKGYWNKILAGQDLEKAPLPEYEKCPRIQKYYPGFDIDVPQDMPVRLVPEAFALEEQLLQKEALPEMAVSFNLDIRLTNQFVLNTKRDLEESMKRINNHYDFGRCTSGRNEAFSMQIGPASIPRAMAILQTLCDALEKRGYPVGIEPGHGDKGGQSVDGRPKRVIHPVCANVLDTHIFFQITETSNKVNTTEIEKKRTYQDFKYVPTGKLCFEIINHPSHSHARSKWHDGKVAKVEDQINDIIVNMIRTSTSTKESKAWSEVESKKRAIEEAERQKQELQNRMNKIRQEHLAKQADRYLRYKQIKEYFETMTAEGRKRLGDAYPGSDFSKWVEWAESYLKEIGPGTWELPKFEVAYSQWDACFHSVTF
ncbi:MAG: hypothetical protein EOM45_10000 [Clostridia bacterium]|nr:hypothetical protein [Clostridia bacterium]